MSIKNVQLLQELKAKLESYDWRFENIVGNLRFTKNRGPRQLSIDEYELLESVLFGNHSVFPKSIGLAVKKLVMLRLDTAINYEARSARAEAQRVLDLLAEE